jgi:hypothetical protein
MAPFTTHLVIGERVFPQLQQLKQTQASYGTFLLGCLVVDTQSFSKVDRRVTHFADRMTADGPYAYDQSCANFLRQLKDLLVRPWVELTDDEQAFAAGYFCHLAVDQNWKEFDVRTLNKSGLFLWADEPVHGSLKAVVFDILSKELYLDHPGVIFALEQVTIPEIFRHVSLVDFQRVRDVAEPYIQNTNLKSSFELLKRASVPDGVMEELERSSEVNWDRTVDFINTYFGGVEARMQAMLAESQARLPDFWQAVCPVGAGSLS